MSTHKADILRSYCHVWQQYGDDSFVGLKYENDSFGVFFPIGYTVADSDKDVRSDILNLISVLSSFSDKKESYLFQKNTRLDTGVFPIHAYISVITYFLNNGYYRETKSVYKNGKSGRINWNRTIKTKRPMISSDDPVYIDFVVKSSPIKNNELITLINKYCVWEAFRKVGFLFSSYVPEKPELPFNASLFLSVLQNKREQTFDDKYLSLFKDMYEMIMYLGSSNDKKEFYYGTNSFEYVWQNLINTVYGEDDKIKESYFPHTQWHIQNGTEINSPLMPDTIMICDEQAFILDAKYYKYGVLGHLSESDSTGLPGTDSISKQIIYAEYVEAVKDFEAQNIYNVFLLPGHTSKGNPLYFGYADADWHSLKQPAIQTHKPYLHVEGIILDTKTIMRNHSAKNQKSIAELASLIENQK